MICPGRSDLMPVIRAAEITDPAWTTKREAGFATRSGLVVRRSTAAQQGRRPHCGDRCCTALRKLDHAYDSAAGPTALLRKRERARVPCPRPIPYATGESRADVLDAGAVTWLSLQHSSTR